jgi:hypothetical protein
MSTATRKRKPPAPDWSAINHGMNARQRREFNRFLCLLSEHLMDLECDIYPSDLPPITKSRFTRIRKMIASIPAFRE